MNFKRALARRSWHLCLGMVAVLAAAHSTAGQLDDGAVWLRITQTQRLSESWLEVMAPRAAQVRGAPAAATATVSAEQGSYPLGLMWIAPAARPDQRRQLRGLLEQLGSTSPSTDSAAAPASTGHPQRWTWLRQALASMPITGRVLLPAHDPHWLAANPHEDPVLAPGDEWWLPVRPTVVRVWHADGTQCDVAFEAGSLTRQYIHRCAGGSPGIRDTAWLVQPDGRVQRIGLAAWNRAPEPLPAPGAWLWVPSRDDAMPDSLSDEVARWLATQSPAGTDAVPSAETLLVASSLASTRQLAAAGTPGDASAAQDPAPHLAPRAFVPLASDWGVTGLLQTPTARTRAAGAVGLSISRIWPYTQFNLVLSPFERLEVAVRYTNVSNALYGPTIAGEQSYKDKSAEIKFRLLDEGYWTPAVAVGLRDPGGTSLFGGEYLVASKRWADWDFSLGLGWGYLGQRGDLGNPLARVGWRSDQRQGSVVASGGTANLAAMFTGPVALFGGVQWQSPWDPLLVKLEWDGNDYRNERYAGALPTRTALNAGLAWRWGDAELGVSYQRGNRWALNLAWFGSLPQMQTPKTALPRMPSIERMASATPPADPPSSELGSVQAPPPGQATPSAPPIARNDKLLQELSQHTGWQATALDLDAERWTVHFDHASGAHLQERVERVWAVLHRDAPAQVTVMAIELASRQLPLMRYEVDRHAWADSRSRHLAPHQRAAVETLQSPAGEPSSPDGLTQALVDSPRLASGINLSFQQHLGGPDGYLYALSARGFAQFRAWDGGWLQGSVNLRLLDNYHQFKYTAPSALPRVRTLQREYVTTSRFTLPNLQFTQVARLAPGLYGMAYAGMLEPMFAGVGGELLYRPLNSPWALGLDLNLVRQRAVEQDLSLADYQVATGHLTLRWDTGWNDVVAGVSVGQYLAGDRGITLDMARVFANGTRMGFWVTRTNVSAEQFGEGSFDKGLYFAMPFDALFTGWSGAGASIAWQPLIRDGGAKLQRGASLWGLTELRDNRLQTWHSPAPSP